MVQPETTRDRILSAALRAFGEFGYAGTTTRLIASEAGVAEKTIFEYFRSKQALHVEVMQRSLTDMIEPMLIDSFLEMLETTTGSFRETVLAIAQQRVEFAEHNPAVVKLIAQEFILDQNFRDQVLMMWGRRIVPHLRGVLATAREQGELRDDVDDFTALHSLLSMIVSFGLVRAVSPTATAVPQLEALLDVVLRGLRE